MARFRDKGLVVFDRSKNQNILVFLIAEGMVD